MRIRGLVRNGLEGTPVFHNFPAVHSEDFHGWHSLGSFHCFLMNPNQVPVSSAAKNIQLFFCCTLKPFPSPCFQSFSPVRNIRIMLDKGLFRNILVHCSNVLVPKEILHKVQDKPFVLLLCGLVLPRITSGRPFGLCLCGWNRSGKARSDKCCIREFEEV